MSRFNKSKILFVFDAVCMFFFLFILVSATENMVQYSSAFAFIVFTYFGFKDGLTWINSKSEIENDKEHKNV